MATVILQAAGAFLGGAFGSVGSAIGSAAGALAGYALDRSLIESTRHYEGARLSETRPFSAEEGATIPRVYGTMRIGGTLIWATRFEEESTTTRQGFKGGAKTTSYSYFANAAFTLCEGEIAGVRRIWADGREVDREQVDIRIYRGTEDQDVDPLIEAKQGTGNAPAYRGTAYAVIERFPIDDYGRRLPQFQFEVLRPVDALDSEIRSVALIPGATEYGLSTEPVTLTVSEGETQAVNRHVLSAGTDIEASLDELQMLCPNLESVALVVSWFGDDLRADQCRVRPMVTQADPAGLSRPWIVSGIARGEAAVVSQSGGGAAYGGTPSDKSVLEAIAEIKGRGLKVMLYPFIMMDVPADNALPDPYGAAAQPAYPWRGRITCDPAPGRSGTPDKTAATADVVAAFAGAATPGDFAEGSGTIDFAGAADDWGYRRLVLHYAHLAVMAGGVDGFLIGSELRGLTTLRDDEDAFPFVVVLEDLAGEVRALLGPDTRITYGADWSEYFGHQPADGSGDVFFHLDSLWAHAAIDAVGVDNYMPLSDWRDADYAGGSPDGFASPYDAAGLRAAIASGEGYDWHYATFEDRRSRQRSPIADGAYGKDWVFRCKDLVGWWSNTHFNRPGGVESGLPTAWVPQSKPVWFTELGCPAVDKGPNQPNVFPDPKSAEDAVPYFSNGGRSDLAQRRFLAAHYSHWNADGPENPISAVYGGPMVDPADICLWAWDVRPFPAFPLFKDVWKDGRNWARGHWLNGRAGGLSIGDLINAVLTDFGLPPADVHRADGTVAGYLVSDPGTAREALEPIAELFGLCVRDENGSLIFASEANGAEAPFAIDAYVVEGDETVVERTREDEHEAPASVELHFRDLFNEHQSATAAAAPPEGGGGGTSFLSFPGVLAAGQAQGLAADWLHRKWYAREHVSFALPMNDVAIRPGSLLRQTGAQAGTEYLVTRVEDGIRRFVKARRVERMPPTPWTLERLRRTPARSYVAGPPLALLLDLPMRTASDAPERQLRLAARSRPWRTQVAFASPEATGFARRSTLSRRATIGRLTGDLAGGFEARIDRATTITVALLDGELASVSRLQLLNGANAAAIRARNDCWEVFQFETAEEIEPSVWRLGNLLRGQLGTDDAMAAGADEGTPFVLLDEAVQPAGLAAAEKGLDLNWRIGPAGYDLSATNFTELAAAGGLRAQTPLSPVHLRGDLVENGDLALSWIRRSRIDADNWLAEEIPLGETEELYRIEIGPAGGAVVRTADTGQPEWLYTAAMMTADLPALPDALDVTVSQISSAVGAGTRTTRTIPLV